MISRFQGEGNPEIAFRVLVAAVDLRIIRKRHQLFERAVHLLRRSFEEATAAGREKGIAAKKILTEQVSDVPARVAGDRDDSAVQLADIYLISFVDSACQPRDSAAIAFMSVNFQRLALQDALIAAG